jgi:hypothetical protein
MTHVADYAWLAFVLLVAAILLSYPVEWLRNRLARHPGAIEPRKPPPSCPPRHSKDNRYLLSHCIHKIPRADGRTSCYMHCEEGCILFTEGKPK